MTERQKRFCNEYIVTGNGAEAARRAGYSERSARAIAEENLTKPDILRAIRERLDALESSKVAQQKEVLEHLTCVLRGEVVEKIATPSGKVLTLPVRESDRLSAADKLLRVSGAYRDKVDVKMDVAEEFKRALAEIWDETET